MSVQRRRAKANRNANDDKKRRSGRGVRNSIRNAEASEWAASGRMACSYGSHDGNPCVRCGAEYQGVKV